MNGMMTTTSTAIRVDLDYPLPEEFSTVEDLEGYLTRMKNPYLSIVYATEFARMYFETRRQHELPTTFFPALQAR